MTICRICLKQSFKEVYDLDYGLPTIREKLIACMASIVDANLLDINYCICEPCLIALNTSYELREKFTASQSDIKSFMTDVTDYENIERFVLEASIRRPNGQDGGTSSTEAPLVPIPKSDEQEQLMAIASIAPQSSQLAAANSGPGGAFPLMALSMPGNTPRQTVLEANLKRLFEFLENKMCNICYRQYPNKMCLKSHIKAVHQSDGSQSIIKRKVLNNLLTSLSPAELRAIHEEVGRQCTPIDCKDCKITLKCVHELQYHIAAIHKEFPINSVHFKVQCNVCKESFSHKYLNLHLAGHELKVKLADIFNTVDMNGQRAKGPFYVVQFWQCLYCKGFYKFNAESINEHERQHHLLNQEIVRQQQVRENKFNA